jgi:amidase
MSISDAYEDNDGLGLAALVAADETTAHELLDEAQARADEHNPDINAIVHRFDDRVRRQIDEGRGQDGPLAGVPSLLNAPHRDHPRAKDGPA